MLLSGCARALPPADTATAAANTVAPGGGVQRGGSDRTLTRATPAEVGMDAVALAEVDRIINDAVLTGAVPGAALAIGRHGRIVALRGYGRLDVRPGSAMADEATIYDLASLTKVIATTTLAMMLVDDGVLDLDAPVSEYLPEFTGPGKKRVTVRNLLLHDAGLPAYAPLYTELRGPDAYLRRIAGISLRYETGSQTVYSDFGPILLGFIIERLTGQALDELLNTRVAAPLGLRETMFNPLGRQPYAGTADGCVPAGCPAGDDRPDAGALLGRIAPTEADGSMPGGWVHGVVHDENARAIGGVAGHAGLFSSARDLARFAQLLLDEGAFDGRRLIDPATVRAFTSRHSAASSRALGWDTPAGTTSSAGAYFSPSSFGHTGFTGTSIWIDPERDLFLILLTNRVNPTRENQRHVPLRREIADAVQRAIISTAAPRG